MDLEKFGLFITNLRKEKEISQEQLAEKLHVNRQTISRWERGLGFPEYESLFLLSRILDVTVDELFIGKRKNEVNALNHISFVICLIFVIIFLILLSFFFTNYKKNVVYTFTAHSNSITIENGFISFFSNQFYINLGDVTFKDNTIYKDDVRYVLFYGVNGKKKFLYSSTLEDDSVYLNAQVFSKHKDNFFGDIYLQVEFFKNDILYKELLILDLNKQYVNDDFFEEDINKIENDFFAVDYLTKNNFILCEKCASGTYFKKIDNFEIYVDLKDKKIISYYIKSDTFFKVEYENDKLFFSYRENLFIYDLYEEMWVDKTGHDFAKVDINRELLELWLDNFLKIKSVVDI